MDIRVLQYFLTVAQEESITRAAEVLRMTQPPLSRQLKDLENELGKQLLIREAKVTLTEDGMLLRKRAEEMIGLMEKTKAELAASAKNISGEIYIGSGETEAISLFAKTAEKLHRESPLLRYHIYSGDAGSVMEKLDKGLIDFGLLIGPVDVEKYDCLHLPVKDRWGILMRKDSPLAERTAICAEELWDQPLIISHQNSNSKEMSQWLQKEIRQLNIVMTYDLLYNATHFVRKGLGYAIALDGIINTSGESELCFRPFSPMLEAGLCVIWKRYQVFSRASKEFLRQLREVCGAQKMLPELHR